MSTNITKQDIVKLNEFGANAQAVKQYISQRGLSDGAFSSSFLTAKKDLVANVVGQYAIAYESARALYFSSSSVVKQANGGRIPLTYKSTLKKYIGYWSDIVQYVWILYFVQAVTNIPIMNSDGSVNLSVFKNVKTDDGKLGALGLTATVILGALATAGITVVLCVVGSRAVKSFQIHADKSSALKSVRELARMVSKGELTDSQYKDALKNIAVIVKQDQQKNILNDILLYTGASLLTITSGYVMYNVMIKKKSLVQTGKDILGVVTRKVGKSQAVSNVATNSALALTNVALKNSSIPFLGSKL